jgi:uncharacterized membrane protein YheB (UPF0754 family)
LTNNNLSTSLSTESLKLRKGIGSLASKDIAKFNDFIVKDGVTCVNENILDELSVKNSSSSRDINAILTSSCFNNSQSDTLSSKDVAECLKNIIKNRFVFAL